MLIGSINFCHIILQMIVAPHCCMHLLGLVLFAFIMLLLSPISFKMFDLSLLTFCWAFSHLARGRGNSTVVSVSVYQAGDPGSRPPQTACYRKVELYHCVIDSFPPVPTTGSKKAVHVLLCLCNNACKRSVAICHKSRALCPVSRLLSVPIWPAAACVKQGR